MASGNGHGPWADSRGVGARLEAVAQCSYAPDRPLGAMQHSSVTRLLGPFIQLRLHDSAMATQITLPASHIAARARMAARRPSRSFCSCEPLLPKLDCDNPTSAEIYMRMALTRMKSSLGSKALVAPDGREFELHDAEHETILKAFESRWEIYAALADSLRRFHT